MELIILICASSIAAADCRPETARSFLTGPHVAGAAHCGFLGQTAIAPSAIGPGEDEYVKVVCRRDRSPEFAGGRRNAVQ